MDLEVGAILSGKVTSITKYGAFVSLDDKKSGMVHISEVACTYVSNIKEFVQEGQTVKMKVLNITEEGKISLSIKKAIEADKKAAAEQRRKEHKSYQQPKPDTSYTWTPKKSEPASFEEMMNQFKASSDEKFSDLKRKNPETRRSKRGAHVR